MERQLMVIVLMSIITIMVVGGARAQGVLRGTVTDALTGESLPGANVFIPGTGLGGATDIEGDYRVRGIPAGTHPVRVSYLGFQPEEFEVEIADGETVVRDIGLLPNTLQGDEVVITAQAAGQAAAINQQVSSNTIVNVVSEERIQELPDANAAEALGRLPGVSVQRSGGEANEIVLRGLQGQFTNVTVNGVRLSPTDAESRGIDLSTISQGSLAGIELYKALTPDKDADAIAGAVNFVTKKAPATQLIRVEARGAYNALNSALGQYVASGRYGNRFLGGVLGVQVTADLERRDRSKENLDLSYSLRDDGTNWFISDMEVNYTDEIRTRRGGSLLLDVATPDGGTIRFNNIYNRTSRDFIEYHRNYPLEGGDMFYGARDREKEISTFTSALTGENYLLGLTSEWGASYARSASYFPFDYEINFTEPSAVDAEGNRLSKMLPVPDSARKHPELIPDYALNNFDRAYLYNAFYNEEENEDEEMTAWLDLSRDYVLSAGFSGTFKMGGKYRQKARNLSVTELFSPYYVESFPTYVMGPDGSIVPKDLTGTPFEGVLDNPQNRIIASRFIPGNLGERDIYGTYALSPIFDRDVLRSWWEMNRNGFSDANGTNPEYEVNDAAEALYYDLTERVAAGYVMNTFDLSRAVTLIAGMRVEREDNDYQARYSPDDLSGFPVPTGLIRDTSAAYDEVVWLPNAHLTIRPLEVLNLRFAVYKALARPAFDGRLPTVIARKQGTFFSGNQLVIGNPNLRAAQAWNYEVNASLFSRVVGLFSVSAYYKEIEDMYHLINGLPFSDNAALDSLGIGFENPFDAPYILTYPFNSSKPTRVWGFEVEHQTNFRYLPGLLKHVVLSYNASVVRSETYIPGVELVRDTTQIPGFPPIVTSRNVLTDFEHKLEGQPEFFGNVALGYDTGRFSARVSVFHQSEYNNTFSPLGTSDGLVDGYTRVDFASRFNIRPDVALLLNVNNITSVKEGTIIYNRVQDWRLPNNSELYGLTASLGLRVEF